MSLRNTFRRTVQIPLFVDTVATNVKPYRTITFELSDVWFLSYFILQNIREHLLGVANMVYGGQVRLLILCV